MSRRGVYVQPAGRSEDEKSDNEVDEEEEKAGGGGITAKKNSRRSAGGGGGGKGRRGKGSGGGNSDKKKKSSSSSSRPTGVSTSKEREGRLTYEEVADMIAQDSHFTGGGEAEERRKGEDGVDDLKSLWTSLPLHVQEYLWKAIEDEVNSRYEKCIGEARTSLRDQNRQKIEKKTQDLQTAYEDICLSVKALEVLEIGEDTKHPLLVHFYKTRVGSFVDSLVYAAYTEATAEEVEVTPQNRRCLLEKVKKLGVSPVSDLSKASEMLSKRDAFLSLPDILHAAGEDVHLLFRKPDKRRIKHLLLTKKIEAQSTLNACNPTDPSAVLHAALSLLLTQYLSTFQAYFDFPRDTWAISAVVGLLLSHEKKSKKKTQKSEDQDESEDVTKQENGEIQKHQKEKKTDAKASSSSSSP
ncbi:e3 ufm1-protein ligase 1, partial [Cystoisospora suis]